MMSRRFFRLLPLISVLTIGLALPGPAMAQEAELAQNRARDNLSQMSTSLMQQLLVGEGGLKDDVNNGLETVAKTILEVRAKEKADQTASAPIYNLMTAYNELPGAFATMDAVRRDIMLNRLRELNRVKMPSGDPRADYLVDSSLSASVNTQYFDIFMRYFCDPMARDNDQGDSMEDKSFEITAPDKNGRPFSYRVGCGSSSTTALPSRQSVLGKDAMNEGPEAEQIISLPVRPDVLFFNATTFPTVPSNNKAPTEDGQTNVNRLANVYYSAFAMAMRFLLGEPPAPVAANSLASDPGAFVAAKAQVARQTLATVPFTELFSAQIGTMGPTAAVATADMLQSKLGPAGEDAVILARIDNIRRRNSISVAEYMDVVAYQLLLSPGYYARINTQLNPTELRREAVWLTGLQTALNYQRNRWLEMLAALEAVK